MADPAEIRREIESHRRRIEALEADLHATEHPAGWIPERFYLAYHALAGIIIGAIAAWAALAMNALGSQLIHGDPFRLMRYYATIFTGGIEETNRASVLVMAIGMHTITGAMCGAPIHVVFSRFFPRRPLPSRAAWGAGLGTVMWLVNLYAILSWLQPLLVGKFYINEIPFWVAALTHIAFTVTVLLVQPLGTFDPESYAGSKPGAPARG